jgi:hypothetical protein
MRETRKVAVGPYRVAPVGLGCMSLSHAYGTPPTHDDAATLLRQALELGYDFFDTAALYGLGHNEKLLGEVLGPHRRSFTLASKCGFVATPDGRRVPDGRPEAIRQVCEQSLANLRTDHIDLYYLHRLDKAVPVEESVGALADLVREGKIGAIGLSEVSAATLRRAQAVHPIAALQSEYSLWTRNAELGTLAACRELGTAYVAFSPVGRGVLTDAPPDPEALEPKDIRRAMPRFQGDNWAQNRLLAAALAEVARELGSATAQLALAWVLAQGDHVVAIPGTTSLAHLAENWGAREIVLDPATLARLDGLVNRQTVRGNRYSPAVQADIDTEEFA